MRILLSFLLGWSVPASAVTLHPGDLIVADVQAAGGTLFRVDPATGEQTALVSGMPFLCVATGPDGTLWAGTGNEVGVVDPVAQSFSPLPAGSFLQGAFGLSLDRAGSIFVADEFAITACGNGGNVTRVDPASGAQAIVLCVHFHPTDVVAEADDSVLAVSSVVGLVRFDPVKGGQTDGNSGYRIFVPWSSIFQPRAVAAEADGNLVCTSVAGSSPLGKAVLQVDGVTGNWQYLSRGGYLTDPQGVAVAADGSYLVVDSQALPDGSGGQGAVVRVDPVSGVQTIVSSGGSFRDPVRIAVYGVRNGVVPAVSRTWGWLKSRYR